MKFVYILQVVLVLISMVLGVWNFANWVIKSIIFIMVFIIHELLHILVVYKIGDISLTHSGIFFWLNSNAIIAGSDIINSILIAIKPSNAKFCRGYYIVENNLQK